MKENNISISEDVVVTIAAIATKEVQGVAGLHAGMVDTIIDKVKGTTANSGISVVNNDDKLSINVAIDVVYGYKIQDVAKSIQESIKNSVENMTEKSVSDVNVNVISVVIVSEKNEK